MDEGMSRERCGLARGHEREAETALERAKREIRRLREEFTKIAGGRESYRAVPTLSLESYRAELRNAADNVELLKMCAAGAIAHAQMVEYEAAEMRSLLDAIGAEPLPPVDFAQRVAGWAFRYGQEKMRDRVLALVRDRYMTMTIGTMLPDEIAALKPEGVTR